MWLKEKLKIPTEGQIKNADEKKKPILQQILEIWDNNEISEVESWSEYTDLKESWVRRTEIYTVNGENRYYEFIKPEHGRVAKCRYTQRKKGDAWIYNRMEKEDEDDIDKLILKKYFDVLNEIRREDDVNDVIDVLQSGWKSDKSIDKFVVEAVLDKL